MSPRQNRLLLAAVLILAAVLRLTGIADQGLFAFDEASYRIQSSKVRALIAWIPEAAAARFAGEPAPPPAWTGRSYEETARGGHFLFLAPFTNDAGALRAMVLAGLVSIGLAVRLAASATPAAANPTITGLFAALLLATSPAHVFFSRSLYAEINSGALLLAAVAVRGRGAGRVSAWLAGILFGIGFTMQPRFAFLVPFLVGAELLGAVLAARNGDVPARIALKQAGIRIARQSGGFAAALLAVEAVFVGIRSGAGLLGNSVPLSTYLDQFAHQSALTGTGITFVRAAFPVRYLAFVESVPALLTGLAALAWGLVALLRPAPHRTASSPASLAPAAAPGFLFWPALAAWVAVVGALFEQRHFPGYCWGRLLFPAVLALGIATAATLGLAWSRGSRHVRAGVLVVLAAILLARLEHLPELVTMRAGHAAILEEASRRTNARHVFSEQPIHVMLYLGADSWPARFSPRTDSLTVVVFDDPYAWNYPFRSVLPDTCDFTIEGIRRAPRLAELEEGLNRLERLPSRRAPQPVKVWVLPPEERPRILRAF